VEFQWGEERREGVFKTFSYVIREKEENGGIKKK